ncbi:MAG: fibronectin type III domain-containing protein [Fibrella sp.]|nr:fibronectin type III domain-containing protein [Armatimonadota bacterium]
MDRQPFYEQGFLIERKGGTAGDVWSQIASVAPNAGYYADTGLQYSTLYTYRVRAYKGVVFSPYSSEASARTYGADHRSTSAARPRRGSLSSLPPKRRRCTPSKRSGALGRIGCGRITNPRTGYYSV